MSYVSVCQADSPLFLYLLDEASGTSFADKQNGSAAASGGTAFTYHNATGFPGQPFGLGLTSTLSVLARGAGGDNITTTQGTWEWVMSFNGSLAGQPFIMGKGYDGTNAGFATMLTSAGHVALWHVAFGIYWDSGFVAASDTTCRHYMITLNGTVATLYVNGTQQATGAPTGTVATTSTTNYEMGGAFVNGSVTNQMAAGVIACMSIYNTPLSSARVTAHYNALSAATGGRSIKTPPPGLVVSALAHDRNHERKTGAELTRRHRISDYYRHHRRS